MYRCQECGEVFLTPKIKYWKELHTELDTGNRIETKTYIACPYCEGDMVDEGQVCEFCGDNFTTDDFCEECFNKVTDLVDVIAHENKQTYKTTKELFLQWAERNW